MLFLAMELMATLHGVPRFIDDLNEFENGDLVFVGML